MAEAVQYHLERMVGELEDLERHQVFTKSELRQLVKKRTSFEYTLKRRRAQPVDYLRYIRYELNVDRLRRLRDQRRTQPDHTTTRVVSIFERLLARHNKADLWTQYIGFLMQRNNKRLLSKAFARAIVAHPRVTRLWIMAARYQLEQIAGSAARRLLQRALRVNPEAKDVWLEYFKLELHLVEKIRMRRRVL
ncbi:U3 small nucleolar RNA-associated protein 6-domain-containing protein, partial [Coemansia spiralis]